GVIPSAFGEPKDWAGINHRIKWDYVSRAVRIEEAHSHDFEEFLCFIGTNPSDTDDFGAEIEVSMGTEGEKHTITTAAIICLPAGVQHAPIFMKKVDRPFYFGHCLLADSYGSSQFNGT
ncbi:MAG: hypothetical protein JW927_20265, partial [Deltaproteobacteria bacterium]|nr:hypothetical protein [Deltaproteobacteria bacterium]